MTQKRFPANTTLQQQTFLNDKKINGELYGLLQGLSEHDGTGTYVLKKKLPTQTKICEIIGIKSPKTLRVHLKYLIERDYVIEEKDKYYLPLSEDIYLLIPLDTVNYLNDNCKEHVYKIYIYLGQRWKWAQARKEPYCFSYREIGEHIGLSGIKENIMDRQIKNALDMLYNSGLINFKSIQKGKTYYKELTDYSFVHKENKE